MTQRRAVPTSALSGESGAGRAAVRATAESSVPADSAARRPTLSTSLMPPRTRSTTWVGRRTASMTAPVTSSAELGARLGSHGTGSAPSPSPLTASTMT